MVFSFFFVLKFLVLLHYGICRLDIDPGPTTPSTTTSTTTRTTTTRTTTRTTTKPTYTGYGARSRQKCVEYQRYVFKEEFFGVLFGKTRVSTCSIVPVGRVIVGGTEATPREFPHMALIGFNDPAKDQPSWQCGGSLISDEFVLTAAHCLYFPEFDEPKYVRLGELQLDTNQDDAQIQDFTISQLIRHPDYKPPSKYNDIALLKLNRKVRLNPYARPACLHTTMYIPGLTAVACGWGKVGSSAEVSKHLLKVTLEFFTNLDCNRTYRTLIGLKNGIVETSQVCAGHHTEAKDTCQGDSGGPLQIVNPDPNIYCMYSIVGVTSFGKPCGTPNIPGVYTRVSNYVDWIEEIVWP